MEQYVGMMLEEAVKAFEEAGLVYELDRYETGEVFGITMGKYYYADHVEFEVEDGKLVDLEYVEWE